MATVDIHRGVRIVTLSALEAIEEHCRPGDIAIRAQDDGWWTSFIAEDGSIDSYDEPYPSCQQAIWAARAAAEFGV